MDFDVHIYPSNDTIVDIEVDDEWIEAIRELANSEELEDNCLDTESLEEKLPEIYNSLRQQVKNALQEQFEDFGQYVDIDNLDFSFDIPEEIFEELNCNLGC